MAEAVAEEGRQRQKQHSTNQKQRQDTELEVVNDFSLARPYAVSNSPFPLF